MRLARHLLPYAIGRVSLQSFTIALVTQRSFANPTSVSGSVVSTMPMPLCKPCLFNAF